MCNLPASPPHLAFQETHLGLVLPGERRERTSITQISAIQVTILQEISMSSAPRVRNKERNSIQRSRENG